MLFRSSSKSEDALTDLYSTTWVTHHGSFETLYVDGKSSLTNPNAKARLHRLGTKVQARAPEQDARFPERHGRALRLRLPEAEDQCSRDSLRISLKSLLAECVFIGNALTVGDNSPYPDVWSHPNFASRLCDDRRRAKWHTAAVHPDNQYRRDDHLQSR